MTYRATSGAHKLASPVLFVTLPPAQICAMIATHSTQGAGMRLAELSQKLQS